MSLDDYVNQPWFTSVETDTCDESPCFVARNPELGSCIGQGNTREEALADLESARRDLITVMLDCGDPIPEPAYWNELMQNPPTLTLLSIGTFRPVPIPQPIPSIALQVA